MPVDVKLEFIIRRLVAAGHRLIEVTSLVHPRWVPQLADAEQLIGRPRAAAGGAVPVLVPNLRGYRRAAELGLTDIAIFGSATETFARRNLNRGVEESLAMFEPVVARRPGERRPVRAYLSMCFATPGKGRCRWIRWWGWPYA